MSCSHLEGTVNGTRLAYLTKHGEVIVLGIPDANSPEEGPGSHNCDEMGCGQEHVIERRTTISATALLAERDALAKANDALRAENERMTGVLKRISIGIFGRGAEGDTTGLTDWELARAALNP